MRNRRTASPVVSFICILVIVITGLLCVSSGSNTLNDLLSLNSDTSTNKPVYTLKPTVKHTPLPSGVTPDPSQQAEPTPEADPNSPSFKPEQTLPDEPGTELIGEYSDDSMAFTIKKVVREKVTLYKVDLRVSSADVIKTAFANNKITGRAYTSKTAEKNNAILAINGDFCGYNKDGVIIRNGVLYRDVPSDNRESLMINKYGNFNYAKECDVSGEQLIAQGVLQSFSFGPILVNNYTVQPQSIEDHFLSTRAKEPRTAIGQIGPLHYLILVIDGRSDASEGMTMEQLANEFIQNGAQSAYGLDGGGSSTLYYNGNVINAPCVNGERAVSDIVYLVKP